jgi:hypothetical protein
MPQRQFDESRGVPSIRQVVLDTTEPRRLAEFYRELFGLSYRAGDEPPAEGEPDPRGDDWLVLRNPVDADRGIGLAFQKVDELAASTWPGHDIPQQLHLDTTVPDVDSLVAARARAIALGATEVLDRTADPEEALTVLTDPSGHPFCIFVSAD